MAERPLGYGWLLSLYGQNQTEVVSYRVGSQWLSYSGEYLYWNSERIVMCAQPLLGVADVSVAQQQTHVAACGNELFILSEQGELIERLGSAYALPSFNALGVCGAERTLCVNGSEGLIALNLETLVWTPVTASEFEQLKPLAAPETIADTIRQQLLRSDINWERFLLDLHAGRSFGLGPWLMDVVALLMIVLALSGLVIWWGGRRRRSRSK